MPSSNMLRDLIALKKRPIGSCSVNFPSRPSTKKRQTSSINTKAMHPWLRHHLSSCHPACPCSLCKNGNEDWKLASMVSYDVLVVSSNQFGIPKRRGFTASIFPMRGTEKRIVVSANVMATFLFAASSTFVKNVDKTVDDVPNIVKDLCHHHCLL